MQTTCSGCGLVLEEVSWPDPAGYAATRECFRLFGELTSQTQTLQDPAFPHQHAVDAYAAQHATEDSPPIKTTFALIGLYLACERGFTGREVQLEHMRLGRRRREWPRFFRQIAAGVTVADVLAERSTLNEWAASVWREWEPDHPKVRELA
ncbi:MAG: DUF5946 family protein [Myxococcales bacterium]|nr:DUF5946 family protein [Myxococcales bacterium]